MTLNEYQKKPVMTADGKQKWVQNCLYCNKQVNFIKDGSNTYVLVGDYVRHRRCYPPPAK